MTVLRILITIIGFEIKRVKMMRGFILLLLLTCCTTAVKAHDFANTTGGTVVASFDLSGSDLWHSFFLPNNILLAQRAPDSQEEYRYINHPHYIKQELPTHRLVCVLEGDVGNDQQNRCSDEFPHVHFDDFRMALNFANDMCSSYGAGVVADFLQPTTFVALDNTPAASHHYFYSLSQGLKFDCVAPVASH